ncbi:MAG: hypothetical protein IKX28_01165 [Bacteroidales bacterium]|nr:hypothetical protein [Bacteroidales bacterium]
MEAPESFDWCNKGFKYLIKSTLIAISTFTLIGCSFPKQRTKTLFKSTAIQDTLELFLNQVNSFYVPEETPPFIQIILFEENGRDKMELSVDSDDLIVSVLDTTQCLLCKGVIDGKFVVVWGNPKYKSLLNWRHFKMNPTEEEYYKVLQHDAIERNSNAAWGYVPEWHKGSQEREYIIHNEDYLELERLWRWEDSKFVPSSYMP